MFSSKLLVIYTMPLAMNGDSGLKYVADEIPDLILLDIMKPDIDGYVAYRRLKPIPEQTGYQPFFLTSMSGAQNQENGLQLGTVDFINLT